MFKKNNEQTEIKVLNYVIHYVFGTGPRTNFLVYLPSGWHCSNSVWMPQTHFYAFTRFFFLFFICHTIQPGLLFILSARTIFRDAYANHKFSDGITVDKLSKKI